MLRRAGVGAPAAIFLLFVLAASIAFPLGAVICDAFISREPAADSITPWGVGWGRLGRSLLVAAQIGVLATLCAWPASWAARALPARWLSVLLVPMLMPSYLAYIGWSQLRAPGNPIGDFLMRGPAEGPNWWQITAGQVCAIGGLVLWSWPLAMLILGARIRRLDPDILDALRLEPAPAWRRTLALAALCRGSLLAAALAVSLVMLGSAVPLHIAQLDTYAIEIWRLLDSTPPGQHGRVWVASWPLILIALLAGLWIGRRIDGAPETGGPSLRGGPPLRGGSRSPRRPAHPAAGRTALVITSLLWLFSVIAPGLLMSIDIRHAGFIADFWRTHAGAFTVTALVACAVALIAGAIATAVWMGLSAHGAPRWGRVTRWSIVALVAAGLTPGILVGYATATAWNRLGIVSDTSALVSIALAHTARLGFVGALVGWWAARSEAPEERALRRIDGADTIPGWFRAAWPTQSGLILAATLAVGLLSFHEIEASVMLQPPGLDSFPRQMLQLLHYNRMEDVAGAVVVVLGCGLLASAAVVALGSIGVLDRAGVEYPKRRSSAPPTPRQDR